MCEKINLIINLLLEYIDTVELIKTGHLKFTFAKRRKL